MSGAATAAPGMSGAATAASGMGAASMGAAASPRKHFERHSSLEGDYHQQRQHDRQPGVAPEPHHARGLPQLPQNREPAGLTYPHDPQAAASGYPQAMQNFASDGFSAPHEGQASAGLVADAAPATGVVAAPPRRCICNSVR